MSEYNDSHMLSSILERMAAQAMHLKEKIDAGLEIPSWAEYKLYSAYDAVGKALGTAYPGEYVEEDAEDEEDEMEDDEKMAAAFTPALDRHPALKGKQSKLPDRIQAGIIKKQLQIKTAAATATKTDPQKWEEAKAEAKAKMGGKHSARAMQLATQIYKKDGGGYSGAKPTASNNSLKKWTKQDWNWTGGDKPGQGGRGVYLPEDKVDRLRESEEGKRQLASAARKKREATRKGEQYSSHGLAANTSLRSKK
jgi:hypothetical protein